MSTQKKLTSMKQFIDRLKNDFNFVVSNNITEMYLEKEKQQIIYSYEAGYSDGMYENGLDTGKEYYEETYKKD